MNKQQLCYVEEFYNGQWQADTYAIPFSEAELQLIARQRQYPNDIWRIRRLICGI